MKDFQNLELAKGKRLYHEVADKLALLAQDNKGKYGYGVFGAVVGCTEAEKNLRADYPNLFFLIPGYGAQSGSAQDAALLLREGNGGVVNASRSIITAWQKETSDSVDNNFAAEAARRAAVKMRDDIRAAIS
jgi:orotidine-5'-phosphate decarboxylase